MRKSCVLVLTSHRLTSPTPQVATISLQLCGNITSWMLVEWADSIRWGERVLSCMRTALGQSESMTERAPKDMLRRTHLESNRKKVTCCGAGKYLQASNGGPTCNTTNRAGQLRLGASDEAMAIFLASPSAGSQNLETPI